MERETGGGTMMRWRVFLAGVVVVFLVAFSGCGGCGKKAAKEEEQPAETEEISEEIPSVPSETPVQTPEVSEAQPSIPSTPATTPQPTTKKRNILPPSSQPQPQQPQPQPPEYEYQVLYEEQREFEAHFTMWGGEWGTWLENIFLPEDVVRPQQVDVTALFILHTPEDYTPKIKVGQNETAIPLPVEGNFEAPDKIILRGTEEIYLGEYCVEERTKEKEVTLTTKSGSKVVDITAGEGWDMIKLKNESNWPKRVTLPEPQKEVRNIEVAAVISPPQTTLEVPAKLYIPEPIPGTVPNPGVKGDEVRLIFPSYPNGFPEAKIEGKLVVGGEVLVQK